ncbi:hypothetical protein MTYP_00355 [Methylophilaceae bacterium]|nr:hypothetical protein MTYP_00355 [Methylophilaceae bacterium]
MIDWANFSPLPSFGGGLLIGLAAAILIIFNGRIAGVSGILGGIFIREKGNTAWRLMFLAGLVAAPLVYGLVSALPAVVQETGPGLLFAAGLLVGLGTYYGSGCTSGHGVCGLSRLSLRSLAATLTFMTAGIATVWLVRYVTGWE